MNRSVIICFFLVYFFCNLSVDVVLGKSCMIKGKVTGRNSTSIVLFKSLDDQRFANIFIPVSNGSFHYKLEFTDMEAYSLIFKDELYSGRPIVFFPDSSEVLFSLYPSDEFDKNIVQGGKFNRQYRDYNNVLENKFRKRIEHFQDTLEVLSKNHNYDSDTIKSLNRILKGTVNRDSNIMILRKMEEIKAKRKNLTPQAREIRDRFEPLIEEMYQWKLSYIEDNPTIVNYYLLNYELAFYKEQLDASSVEKLKEKFSQLFVNHSYNSKFQRLKLGERFIDFSLPDLDGEMHTISKEITGKVAILDFWATWCGPCIEASRSLIPVYQEFRKKGFTVVGVAAEIHSTDQLKKRINQDKYPWVNLVELDHMHGIWDKYGLSNSGGSCFLIDMEGKVLARNPTSGELRKILTELLTQRKVPNEK